MTTIHGCLTKTVKYNAATASKMAAALSSMARRAKTPAASLVRGRRSHLRA